MKREYPTIDELIEQDVVFMGSDWDDNPDPDDPEIKKDGIMEGSKYLGEIPCVNCNDLFGWGFADAENISDKTLLDFHTAMDDCDGDMSTASELYCARQRGMRPQGACYTYYKKKYWPLFDACGPEREVGFGNPYKPGKYRKKWWEFWK